MLVTEQTFPRILEQLDRCSELVVDLETTGLHPYAGDRLFGAAIGAGADVFYFPLRHKTGTNLSPTRRGQLLATLASGKTLGGHNFIRFDCPMLAVEEEPLYRALLHDGRTPKWDTIIDALLANENEPSFSLDALGRKYLGPDATKAGHKARLLEALQALPGAGRLGPKALMGRMSELPPELVEPYACGDIVDCRRLHVKYLEHHKAWGLERLAREMYDYARLLAKIERRGLLVDREECERRIVRCNDEQEAVRLEIAAVAGPKYNPNSWQQNMLLCGTEDGKAETLMRSSHPLAAAIVKYKQLGKMRGTYYEGILRLMDAAGVIHPQLNLSRDPTDVGGTRSGRLSCSNPNFQNLPKHSTKWYMRVRELVMARPGHVIMPFDYERQEMWLGGSVSGDEALEDAYLAGRDLYQELAEEAECSRHEAKITWLAIQYGAGAYKLAVMHGWPFKSVDQLARDFGTPVERWGNPEWEAYKSQRAVRTKDAFFAMCPGIKRQMEGLMHHAEQERCMRLWTGRVVHFDGAKTKPFAAWNRLIQGGSGEMTRLAMQRMEEPLEHYGAAEVLQVHDEVVVEAPEEHARPVAKIVSEIMCDFDFKLRPRVDPMIGKSYGAVTKFKELE